MNVTPVRARPRLRLVRAHQRTRPNHLRLLEALAQQRMLDGWMPLLGSWQTRAALELDRLGVVERARITPTFGLCARLKAANAP